MCFQDFEIWFFDYSMEYYTDKEYNFHLYDVVNENESFLFVFEENFFLSWHCCRIKNTFTVY